MGSRDTTFWKLAAAAVNPPFFVGLTVNCRLSTVNCSVDRELPFKVYDEQGRAGRGQVWV